jgi:hypothetical protein
VAQWGGDDVTSAKAVSGDTIAVKVAGGGVTVDNAKVVKTEGF